MSEELRLEPGGRHYASEEITVWYDARRCRHAAECVRGDAAVFETGRKPWIQPDLGLPEHIAEVVRRCPTGALHYRLADGVDGTPGVEEPATVPTQVTFQPNGAIWVRGDLALETPDGVVAERRAALCGCGRTRNRPYCDGICDRPVAEAAQP